MNYKNVLTMGWAAIVVLCLFAHLVTGNAEASVLRFVVITVGWVVSKILVDAIDIAPEFIKSLRKKDDV